MVGGQPGGGRKGGWKEAEWLGGPLIFTQKYVSLTFDYVIE